MLIPIKQKNDKKVVRLTGAYVALSDVIINQLESIFSLLSTVIHFFQCLQSYVLSALPLRHQDKGLSAYLFDQIFFITWCHVNQVDELNSFGGQFIEQVENEPV